MKAPAFIQSLAFVGLIVLPSGCDQYDPYNPNTANLEGVWTIDNDYFRKADEQPIWKMLTIYATHMEFCPGQGTVGTQGQWKDDGFWCEAKDGSGEIEAAKVISPEEIELHLAAFYPGSSDVLTLYKQEGNDEEKRAVAAKYSPPYTYPPPHEVITEGMTEYELKMLPWKPDKIVPSPSFRTGEAVYYYHSDVPNRSELEVTVRNHVVIRTSGGNA